MPIFKLTKAERDKVTAAALLTAGANNEVLGELRDLVRGIEAGWQAAWDKRSERWQESTAGQSAAEPLHRGTHWRTTLKISKSISRTSGYLRLIDCEVCSTSSPFDLLPRPVATTPKASVPKHF